jgi:anthranilate phosphoribosyltransferase
MSALKPFLDRVADGTPLTESEAKAAFDVLMSGAATDIEIAGFLVALRVRGETVDEIVGAARSMRARAVMVEAPEGAIDTVGTGGDGRGTYNISTAAALVTAACGVPVAKHGNRAVSSKSGAADVLAELGVNIETSPDSIVRSLREANIGFLFSQRHHGAMKHVAGVRRELGLRTILNLTGPLCNPAGAKRQLLGVYSQKWLVPMAHALMQLGSDRAWVVHGSDGLDEITTTGPTFVAELADGAVRTFEITPEDAGVKRAKIEDLSGGDAAFNAAAMRTLLHGRGGPYRDIVTMNAGAALVVAQKANDLKTGTAMALDAIMAGKAAKVLNALCAISHGKAA